MIVWPRDPVRAACEAPLPALAALCLAERGDAESLAAMGALEKRAEGEERELLATARQKLEKR